MSEDTHILTYLPDSNHDLSVSLKNSFSSRSVTAKDCSLQITLPRSDLDEHDVERGNFIPADWSPGAGDWRLTLDPFDDAEALRDEYGADIQALEIVAVGGSLGLTIPAATRHTHDLDDDDEILLDCQSDGYYIDFDLLAEPVIQ